MRLHPLVALALLLPAHVTSVGSGVQWFTFYDFWVNPALEKPPFSFNFTAASKFINLPMFDLPPQSPASLPMWQALGGSLNVVWDVEKASVFHSPCAFVDCSKVAQSGLVAGWQAKLDHAIEEVKALEAGCDFRQSSAVSVGFRVSFGLTLGGE